MSDVVRFEHIIAEFCECAVRFYRTAPWRVHDSEVGVVATFIYEERQLFARCRVQGRAAEEHPALLVDLVTDDAELALDPEPSQPIESLLPLGTLVVAFAKSEEMNPEALVFASQHKLDVTPDGLYPLGVWLDHPGQALEYVYWFWLMDILLNVARIYESMEHGA